MATLLSIAQNAARRAGFGTTQLSTVVGNQDEFAQQVLGLMNASGRRIMRAHDWSFLINVDNTVTTVDGTPSYSITSDGDFDRIVSGAEWDQSNNWRMRGSLSTQEWRFRKDAIVPTNQIRKVYQIRGSTVYIDPTPSATETLSFPYVRNTWCESSGGTGQSEWLADTDVAVIDEELLELDVLWRLLNGRRPYFEEKEEFERALMQRIADDNAFGPMRLDDPPSRLHLPNIPESGFGS